MDLVSTIFSGFALAAPAGLNAWLPLLIAGLAARFQLFGFTLAKPFDLLSETPSLIALSILLFIEIFADKIPAVDTVNDIIHTFIRPTAGGILFASQSGVVSGLDPVPAFILGLLSAGGVHAVKATARPIVTATTGGIGNPIVSSIEDAVSAGATILAIAFPLVAAVLMAVFLSVAVFFVLRWRNRRRRRKVAEI
jgi:hypothetical protein